MNADKANALIKLIEEHIDDDDLDEVDVFHLLTNITVNHGLSIGLDEEEFMTHLFNLWRVTKFFTPDSKEIH